MDQLPAGPTEEAKAMARDAGGWLKQRGCLFWGIAIVVGLYALGSILPDTPEQKAKAVAEQAVDEAMTGKSTGALTKATPGELLDAYAANEVAAKGKYGDRVLEVTGKVHAITLDMTDDPQISFESGDRFDHVTANFDKETGAATANLKKGQQVTVRCEKVSEVLGTPVLMDCVLVP